MTCGTGKHLLPSQLLKQSFEAQIIQTKLLPTKQSNRTTALIICLS
jgi:hypothetical protein